MYTPKFGDKIINVVAGAHNPRRTGFFVKVKRIPRGHMNPGVWWECTDGNGDFWLSNPENIQEAK